MGATPARGGDRLRCIFAPLGPEQRWVVRVVAHLIDASILARLANTSDASHSVAARAVVELHRRGEILHITPQNLVEFRNAATRPTAANGLGLAAVESGGGGVRGDVSSPG